MPDVLATNLSAARDLAASLRTTRTNASGQTALGYDAAALGLASTGASTATTAAVSLLERLADRCQSLGLGVDAAADHADRVDV